MGNFIKEAFERVNIQTISGFILTGGETITVSNESYPERLKESEIKINNRLKGIYQDEEELDKAHGDLSIALSEHQDVYMEIGMKIGARLLHQLLLQDDNIIKNT